MAAKPAVAPAAARSSRSDAPPAAGRGASPRRGRQDTRNRWVGIVDGPNLNRLGLREPDVYGTTTRGQLLRRLHARAAALGVRLETFQSNHEGDLIDRLHSWADDQALAGVVLNPGGLTHTSVALRDAVASVPYPVIEVHLSNPAAREPFRRRSLISAVARGVVSGLGPAGYLAAIEYLAAPPSRGGVSRRRA